MMFNNILRLLRTERGLTQRQMAELLGLTERNYQRYESDGPMPRNKMLLEFSDYYGVSLDYLFGRTEKREINL